MNSKKRKTDPRPIRISGPKTPEIVSRRLFLTPQNSIMNISNRRKKILRKESFDISVMSPPRTPKVQRSKKKSKKTKTPVVKLKLEELEYSSPVLRNSSGKKKRRKIRKAGKKEKADGLSLHLSEMKEKIGLNFRQNSPYLKGSEEEERERQLSAITCPVILRISMDELTSPVKKKKKSKKVILGIEDIEDDFDREWKKLSVLQNFQNNRKKEDKGNLFI